MSEKNKVRDQACASNGFCSIRLEQEIWAPIIEIIEVVNWIALCQCWSIKLDIRNYVAVNLSLKGAFGRVIGVNINAPK